MRRQSSQSSNTSKHGVQSPGSGGEYQPLQRVVKPARRTKIVLPRNHSSARDLGKLARQAQNHHAGQRQRSHGGDTEIRLPGSLDESKATPMRRNMTSSNLPRNTSHTKLKKNLSHGQLTRIGSGKNLAGLNSAANRGPPSPGLKNRNKRPKSADMGVVVKDLHEQEVELAQRQKAEKERLKEGPKEGPKKVGFAVGSSGDSEEETPALEGSGLQEDEWTDQSASASPYSTRQNTANNSRRPSISQAKPPDKHILQDGSKGKTSEQLHHPPHNLASESKPDAESSGTHESESDDEDEPPSPRSQPHVHVETREEVKSEQPPQQPIQQTAPTRSPLHAAKEHPNPATRYLMNRGTQAQVSVTRDDGSSAQASPAPSMRSSRSNIGDSTTDQEQEELVSRFIPSGSHPSTGSASGTMTNTPKTGSFQTPESESTLAAQNRDKPAFTFQFPVSPGSPISGSSGAATPSMARSRTELRMMNEKAVADLEEAAARNPIIPPHVYDRRNESLKTYLNANYLRANGSSISLNPHLSLGPELFQGRFKAVNTELKVVQRFRDPIGESLRRLQKFRGSNFAQERGQRASAEKQRAKMPTSKSTTALSSKVPSKLSTSMSPPKSAGLDKPMISSVKSSAHIRSTESRKGKVTFSEEPPETREAEEVSEEVLPPADVIARQLWDGPMAPAPALPG